MINTQLRTGVAAALLQDLKQHQSHIVAALLDAGIQEVHMFDEDGQPTRLSTLYKANAELFLNVASTPNPMVDAQQVFAQMSRNGYGEWAEDYQRFFYSMNGDGKGFQPDAAAPLILDEWKRLNTIRINKEARLRLEDGEDVERVSNWQIQQMLSLDCKAEKEEIRSGTALEGDLIEGIPQPILTGCDWYDQLCGGVYRGQVDLLVAPSGQGKSSVAVDLSAAGVRKRQYTILIEEEMTASEMRVRIACNLAHVAKWQMRDYGKENWVELFKRGEACGLNPEALTLEDEAQLLYWRTQMDKYLRVYGSSRGAVRSIMRRHRAEWGYKDADGEKIDIVLVWDHMGYNMPEGQNDNHRALKAIAKETVQAAKDEDVAVVSFSQPGAATRKSLLEKGVPDEDPQAALSSELKNAAAHFIAIVRHSGKDSDGDLIPEFVGHNITRAFLCKDRFEGLQNELLMDYDRDHYTYAIFKDPRFGGYDGNEPVGAPS